MLKKHVLIGALATVFTASAVGAQSPPNAGQQQTPRQPQAERPTSTEAQQGATTTLTGCVYRESDVPGRTPNVAEKAGVLEDYILADVKMGSGQSGAPGSTPGATGTAGTAGRMYKLEQIDDERLQKVVGKRVEVTGRIDAEAGDKRTGTPGAATTPDRSVGPDQTNLPEFEVTSMREVSGTCPAKPAAK